MYNEAHELGAESVLAVVPVFLQQLLWRCCTAVRQREGEQSRTMSKVVTHAVTSQLLQL